MADIEYADENGDQQFAEDPAETNFEQEVEGTEVMEAGGDSENPGDKINASKNDDDEKKIFVGGLSWETTVKDLKEYFSKFGDVVDCTLKTDPNTGRSRGFGFVLFHSPADVEKVVSEQTHLLHGRNIDPKRANPRGNKEPIKKVFVGGLDPETPEEDIRNHFGKFGKIEEIDLPYDKNKGQRRAFCFITFESEIVVDGCCKDPKQTIGGKEVDVKKATPKDQQGGFGYGGRGRGGGWGNGPQRGGYNQGWGGNPGYDYSGYSNYGGYGSGYDYGNYGNYGNYDYNNYYNQGWGSYNQGYGNGSYGGNTGYGNGNYGGYDYSGWYANNPGGSSAGSVGGGNSQQQTTPYKAKRGGAAGSSTGGGYHPYNR